MNDSPEPRPNEPTASPQALPGDAPVPSGPALNPHEIAELAQQVSLAVSTGAPLSRRLVWGAREAPTKRLRRTLVSLAQALDQGQPLAEAIERRLPSREPTLGGIIRAGLQTGTLDLLLHDYLQQVRQERSQRHLLQVSLAYPLLLILIGGALILLLLVGLVPVMESVFNDFRVSLPLLSTSVFELSLFVREWGILLLAVIVVGASVGWRGVRFWGGPPAVWRLWCSLPVVGTMWRQSSVAHLYQHLAPLLQHEVPFPTALRLAAGALRDADLRQDCLTLATDAERGLLVPEPAARFDHLDPALQALVRWQRQGARLPDLLRAAAQSSATRARLRATTVTMFVEPLVVFVVAAAIGLVGFSIILPMFRVLYDLS